MVSITILNFNIVEKLVNMIYVTIGGHVFPVMHCADLGAGGHVWSGGKKALWKNGVQLG